MNNKRFNFPSKEVKMFRTKITRYIATVLSVFLVAGVVAPVSSSAQATSPYDSLEEHLKDTFSYGYAGLLDLRLLNGFLTIDDGPGENPPQRALSVAELNGVEQLWKVLADDTKNEDPIGPGIDVSVLELININLGQVSLPLLGSGGLLEFVLTEAQVGVLREFAHAPSANHAIGAVGVVSDSGGLEVTQPGEGANAEINLLSLLNLQSTSIAAAVIDEAHLSLGALSAGAVKPNQYLSDPPALNCAANYTEFDYSKLTTADLIGDTEVLEQEDGRICSSYQIADAELVISSPLVGSLVTELGVALPALLGGVENTLNGLIGTGGLLNSITGVLGIARAEATIDIDETSSINALLFDPLSSSDEMLTIDLATGKIRVDIEKLRGGSGLNGLDPNTSLLTSTELEKITDSITNLLTASAVDEPEGLNAKLKKIIQGENQQGGLYASEVSITVCLLICINPLTLTATLGGLLTPGLQSTTVPSTYNASPYAYYLLSRDISILETVLSGLVIPLLGGTGSIISGLLFGTEAAPGGLLSGILGDLQRDVVGPLLFALEEPLELVVSPLANIIINRQTLVEVEHGSVFTVSALEVNVLDLGLPNGEVVHLPLATASVMAQHWEPQVIVMNVAKIGEGRKLHSGDYTYSLKCTLDQVTIFEQDPVTYSSTDVGTGFTYTTSPNLIALVNGSSISLDPQLPAGAECTLVTDPTLADESFAVLVPTGDNPSRTPYTYFLNADDSGLYVSDDSDSWTSIPDLASINTSSVSDGWKEHEITFDIPAVAQTTNLNIVHAYDVDTRDITVSKKVEGTLPSTSGPFEFSYSIDEGATWSAVTAIADGGSFPITGVPLIDSDLNETQIQVREKVDASNNGGPDVSWVITDPSTTLTGIHDGTYLEAKFSAALGITPAPTKTPVLELTVTNSYPVTIDFEAMLPKTGRTSLVWVIGLGLLAALGALIMFVRSRKK